MVKGTKQKKIRVTEYHPWARFTLFLIGVVFVVAVGAGSFFYGHFLGREGQAQAISEVVKLQELLALEQKQVATLTQELANSEVGAEIDRAANNEVRQQVVTLQEQMASLEEQNAFYKGLMSPSENKEGLTIGIVELQKPANSRSYRYKVVMQQLAKQHNLINGQLQIRVSGNLAGQELVYDIHEIDKKYSSKFIKLRFKYFQTVEGELAFPEGFEPKGLEVVAKSTGKNAKTVEKKFGWLVEEV